LQPGFNWRQGGSIPGPNEKRKKCHWFQLAVGRVNPKKRTIEQITIQLGINRDLPEERGS
jgi:hypothetical protein